jgi:uncharacterized membrane protein
MGRVWNGFEQARCEIKFGQTFRQYALPVAATVLATHDLEISLHRQLASKITHVGKRLFSFE